MLRLEEGAPTCIDLLGVFLILRVQFLDEPGVDAKIERLGLHWTSK